MIATATATASGRPVSRPRVVTALGITQILAWGSTYYLMAVLARPISADTGWPIAWIVGGLSFGLLVSGLCAPRVGRLIQAYGGRPVMSVSSLLLAIGLCLVGLAPNLPVYFAAWLLVGLGMSCGLYDAAFSTLGRYFGKDARRAITTLTLFGGFASTLCWPLSAFMVEQIGWRSACFAYAAIQLLVCMPLHLLALPSIDRPAALAAGQSKAHVLAPAQRPLFLLLAATSVLCGLINSMIAVHLLTILQLRGAELAAAVALGALVGPAQVGARVIEMVVGKRHHPLWTMLTAVTLMTVALVLLWSALPVTALALLIYGAGIGIFSIARGSVPLALFAESQYAAVMGKLAFPSLIVQAAAPSLGGILLDRFDPATLLALLGLSAATTVVLVLAIVRRTGRKALTRTG